MWHTRILMQKRSKLDDVLVKFLPGTCWNANIVLLLTQHRTFVGRDVDYSVLTAVEAKSVLSVAAEKLSLRSNIKSSGGMRAAAKVSKAKGLHFWLAREPLCENLTVHSLLRDSCLTVLFPLYQLCLRTTLCMMCAISSMWALSSWCGAADFIRRVRKHIGPVIAVDTWRLFKALLWVTRKEDMACPLVKSLGRELW